MITGDFTEDDETLVPLQAFIANSHQLGLPAIKSPVLSLIRKKCQARCHFNLM